MNDIMSKLDCCPSNLPSNTSRLLILAFRYLGCAAEDAALREFEWSQKAIPGASTSKLLPLQASCFYIRQQLPS